MSAYAEYRKRLHLRTVLSRDPDPVPPEGIMDAIRTLIQRGTPIRAIADFFVTEPGDIRHWIATCPR